MNEKYLNIDLNDEKSSLIVEILGNKTCKKILNLLADFSELSENDISLKLKIPINTVEYNLKKLENAGFIIKSKNFFWSVKGKRIPTYKLANKKILISTKTSFRGVISSVLAGGLILGAVRIFLNNNSMGASRNVILEKSMDLASFAAPATAETYNFATSNVSLFSNVLIWVLIGFLLGFGIYFILKKVNRMKGGNTKQTWKNR